MPNNLEMAPARSRLLSFCLHNNFPIRNRKPTMTETQCRLVQTSTGNRYACLIKSGRVFFSYTPGLWKETDKPWELMQKHMLNIRTVDNDAPIPDDLRKMLDAE